jgi:hypothetical protein
MKPKQTKSSGIKSESVKTGLKSEFRRSVPKSKALQTPPEKIQASLFVTEMMTYLSPSNKVGNNKEIGKRGGKTK